MLSLHPTDVQDPCFLHVLCEAEPAIRMHVCAAVACNKHCHCRPSQVTCLQHCMHTHAECSCLGCMDMRAVPCVLRDSSMHVPPQCSCMCSACQCLYATLLPRAMTTAALQKSVALYIAMHTRQLLRASRCLALGVMRCSRFRLGISSMHAATSSVSDRSQSPP